MALSGAFLSLPSRALFIVLRINLRASLAVLAAEGSAHPCGAEHDHQDCDQSTRANQHGSAMAGSEGVSRVGARVPRRRQSLLLP